MGESKRDEVEEDRKYLNSFFFVGNILILSEDNKKKHKFFVKQLSIAKSMSENANK